MWLGGLGVQTLGFAIYVIALSQAQVSMVAVMMQGGTAMFVVIAVVVLKERADLREWIGIAATVLGMAMLAAVAVERRHGGRARRARADGFVGSADRARAGSDGDRAAA